MSASTNEEKLIKAIRDITTRLKAEQVRVFKNDITIKMCVKEIARLKNQLKEARQIKPFDFNNILVEVNRGLQNDLNVSDEDIASHIEHWKNTIANI